MKTLRPCTLIGLGHKARQGKNVAAEAMREMAPSDVQLYALADELKIYCRDHHLELLNQYPAPVLKPPKADPIYGYTGILQWFGTDVMRKKDPDYWVKQLQARIERESPAIAIITDVRFPNEARFVKDNGGTLIEIIRRTKDGSQYLDPGRDPNHASETALDDYNGWDFILTCKDGDLSGLRLKAKHAFQVIMETQELYEHPEKYEPPLCELGGRDASR